MSCAGPSAKQSPQACTVFLLHCLGPSGCSLVCIGPAQPRPSDLISRSGPALFVTTLSRLSAMYAQQNYNHPSNLRPQHTQARPSSAAPVYAGSGSRHGHHGHHQGAYQQPPGPPPGGDPQLYQYFSAVDQDRSGSISVTELQSALVNVSVTRTL